MRSYDGLMDIYRGSNGEATSALYRELELRGPIGQVAVNLFRACKASERAKLYRRGRGFKTMAYEKKDWSIGNLSQALHDYPIGGVTWGWAIDEALRKLDDPHHHILYVDLPTGQVSFHCGRRSVGPDYPGVWDGIRGEAAERICRWIAELYGVPA